MNSATRLRRFAASDSRLVTPEERRQVGISPKFHDGRVETPREISFIIRGAAIQLFNPERSATAMLRLARRLAAGSGLNESSNRRAQAIKFARIDAKKR